MADIVLELFVSLWALLLSAGPVRLTADRNAVFYLVRLSKSSELALQRTIVITAVFVLQDFAVTKNIFALKRILILIGNKRRDFSHLLKETNVVEAILTNIYTICFWEY